jgi:hypothetical protein
MFATAAGSFSLQSPIERCCSQRQHTPKGRLALCDSLFFVLLDYTVRPDCTFELTSSEIRSDCVAACPVSSRIELKEVLTEEEDSSSIATRYVTFSKSPDDIIFAGIRKKRRALLFEQVTRMYERF